MKKVRQLKLNIQPDEKIVNKKIREEFTLKKVTVYGGYNLFTDYLRSKRYFKRGSTGNIKTRGFPSLISR